jgi:Flp pilus assembly pilin Flp
VLAADAFCADQSGATDSRVGLVHPVTVAEAEVLNRAVKRAWELVEAEVRQLEESP